MSAESFAHVAEPGKDPMPIRGVGRKYPRYAARDAFGTILLTSRLLALMLWDSSEVLVTQNENLDFAISPNNEIDGGLQRRLDIGMLGPITC
jgi:hypothetical protein